MKALDMTRIGQHYYSSLRQVDIPNHSLQVWPGYTTAVHEYEGGLFLVIDVAHKILRSQTCHSYMNDLYAQHGRDMAEFKRQVSIGLIGSIVLTKYNNKTYRIDDIMWDETPTSQFSLNRNNELISYIDYYKKQYDISINDPRQPMLINRAKRAKKEQGTGETAPTAEPAASDIICLVPELCFLTGLSEAVKNDMHLKKDLAVFTRLMPNQRIEQLNFLLNSIRQKPEALKQITNWGLELDDGMAQMPGRVLPSEKIMFARREIECDAKCDWTRGCSNEQVLSAVALNQWLCVYPANKEQVVERFVTMAMEAGRRIGINVHMPTCVPLPNDRADSYYNEIKRMLDSNVQMVFMVFPMLSDSRYMRVKKLCCIEQPVPSQVACLKTISKPDNVLRTVAQKILLQMNVKLGGELWHLSIPIKKLMIVGIDVYHKTEKKYKSIAGFVSSLNQDQTRWYSKVCFQMVGQELTDTLKPAFMQALKKYREINNFMPEKIVIYRDGVSDGQLDQVQGHEVAQLRSCFASDYTPQVCVIVVQKRINTRIFAATGQDRVNPKPGAVLDHTITSKRMWDFFLVSQHVTQGTVTPTHYIVVADDTKYKPDHIQRLSYKMTHMYYNWSGTIRVPAPCQVLVTYSSSSFSFHIFMLHVFCFLVCAQVGLSHRTVFARGASRNSLQSSLLLVKSLTYHITHIHMHTNKIDTLQKSKLIV